jgi:2-oxoglutarate dehydrogenase E2 component (dihydrolipoamide succinyltransferase)
MSERVTMPALGESVTEGTVTRWLKSVGDAVQVDEPLLEVSTDKVDTEIPSPVAGVLQEILVGEDETVPVGADLAVVGDSADAAGGGQDAGQQAQQEPQDQQQESGESESADSPVPSQDQVPQQQQAFENEPAQAQASPQQAEQPQQTEQPQQQSAPAPSSDNGGGSGTPVTMPALGESVTEGTVTRWLKAEGDTVAVDEPLLEVSTDKVDTEIPSPVAGTVLRILVREDETVPVGAQLAMVGTASGQSGDQQAPAPQQRQAPPQEQAPQQQAPEQPAPEQQDLDARSGQTAATPEPEQRSEQQAPASVPAQPQREQETARPEAPQPEQHEQPRHEQQPPDASAYVTPLVRKLASEHGVDLASLTGTGVGGRIRKQDVLDAARARQQSRPAEQPAPAAAASAGQGVAASLSAKRGTTEKMTRLRRLIAQRMVESLQTSAQLTTVVEVDVTKIARLRDRAKGDFEAREGVKLSFLPFFALAAVEALKNHPVVNASVEDDQVIYHAQENLGIAVDTDKGLLVPVIRDAGDLNIAGLARKVADLAERTRTNKIGPDELGGGTFTLTNTGSRGALFDTPIINQPQVGILGTGAVVKRPVVVTDVDGGETIAIRSMVYLALTYDHRVVDGADAARFLTSMKERLEEGAFDADLGL